MEIKGELEKGVREIRKQHEKGERWPHCMYVEGRMEGYSLRVQSCAPNFVNSNSDETRV